MDRILFEHDRMRGDLEMQTRSIDAVTANVDYDESLLIADTENHRVVSWRPNARQDEIIAGSNGSGSRLDQLNEPLAV